MVGCWFHRWKRQESRESKKGIGVQASKVKIIVFSRKVKETPGLVGDPCPLAACTETRLGSGHTQTWECYETLVDGQREQHQGVPGPAICADHKRNSQLWLCSMYTSFQAFVSANILS
jgi:hypothetical protein